MLMLASILTPSLSRVCAAAHERLSPASSRLLFHPSARAQFAPGIRDVPDSIRQSPPRLAASFDPLVQSYQVASGCCEASYHSFTPTSCCFYTAKRLAVSCFMCLPWWKTVQYRVYLLHQERSRRRMWRWQCSSRLSRAAEGFYPGSTLRWDILTGVMQSSGTGLRAWGLLSYTRYSLVAPGRNMCR